MAALDCIDPGGLGLLLEEFKAGALDAEGREKDAHRFLAHQRNCPACHSAMVDHIFETIYLPAIKRNAAKLGIPEKTLLRAFGEYVQEHGLP